MEELLREKSYPDMSIHYASGNTHKTLQFMEEPLVSEGAKLILIFHFLLQKLNNTLAFQE